MPPTQSRSDRYAPGGKEGRMQGETRSEVERARARPPDWVAEVKRRVGRWADRVGRRWVVAVSGGSDSVGLLHLLNDLAPELGLTLFVAHLDHGSRGDASRRDAAFVSALAGSLGLPFDLGHWRPMRKSHFESDARSARHAWLLAVARDRNATAVALGHTLDDQAETILHRILRGTGPRGLAGMPRIRQLALSPPVFVVRPLIDVSRDSLRIALDARGQAYCEDETNFDLSRTRARIRHELMPRLAAEYNPKVAEALVRLGALAAASSEILEKRWRAWERTAVLLADQRQIAIRCDVLRKLPRFARAEVLRRAWRAAGWPERAMTARHWQRLAGLAGERTPRRIMVPGGIIVGAKKSPDPEHFPLLILERPVDAPEPTRELDPSVELELAVPGRACWAGGVVEAVVEPPAPCDETVDLETLALPLRVRAPRPGDRFQPLGMGGRSASLADFFRSRRVEPELRSIAPLLCDEKGIVWVIGHRIAERVKVTAGTKRTLGLRWKPTS